ncbi:MAG: putative copper-exporting P-type ATPase V [Pelotomaculum sp. PtaU1.Bin035]|nr:MAG: putative copper-exporting P-type ATPase V [Pelotomaculum sp. PtaU1.Bin035]
MRHLPGRVRMLVPGLKGNWSMASDINRKMAEMAGVFRAQANPLTGRVLVVFNETQVKLNNLFKVINDSHNGPELKFQAPPKNNRASSSALMKDQEPEDLPISKQLINVALGGAILAYFGLKHVLAGRTPLAKNPGIFNLAAVTAIAFGYPVLRSGFQSLAKGRVNHDLVMSVMALSTVLIRESIPGLLAIWLTNLTTLGESLVLKGYRNKLPALPEITGGPVQRPEESTIPGWNEAGQEYGRKAVLPALGMASLFRLAGKSGGFQKELAILLAANPSPAGLAAPTAATAAMTRAGKKGILYRDQHTLEVLSAVDTVIFNGIEALPEASYQVADILPAPGVTKKRLLDLAARASGHMDNYYGPALRKALADRAHCLTSISHGSEKTDPVLAGDKQLLTAAGIDTRWGVFKARRLQHLGQTPVFVARQGRLAGLIGIRQHHAAGLRELVNGLYAQGISQIGLIVEHDSNVLRQSAHELGIRHIWPGLTNQGKVELISDLKRQEKKIAVIMGDSSESLLLQEADISICLAANLKGNPVDVVISRSALLPEVFHTAMIAEQRAKQNLAFVRAANAVGLALGATGRLPPMAAVVYNNLISVAVGANSFRLLSGKPRHSRAHRHLPQTARQEIAAALALANDRLEVFQQEQGQQANNSSWHNLPVAEAVRKLRTNLESGLDKPQVLQRMNLLVPTKWPSQSRKAFSPGYGNNLRTFW